MARQFFIPVILFCTGYVTLIFASTIGVATGSRTADGRPLLFKNKDRTDNYPSDVNTYTAQAGEYSYVFQQNDGQTHERVRMGINAAGFGIVYSDSENLEGASSGPYGSQLSAIALKTCDSIQDFRDLLDATNGSRRAHNHFGVIDSAGHGSLFEVDGYSYVEIPVIDSIGVMANTAKFHPSAGPPASGSTSPEREARAAYLMTHGPAEGLDYRYMVDEVIKDFCENQQDEDNMPVGQYFTNPVLSRYKTAAGCVIRGAKAGDDPEIESMMWLCLSEPSLSIALPLFPVVTEVPAFIRSGSASDGMAGSSDRIRQNVYDYRNGRYADRYADTFQLLRIRQNTFVIQNRLFDSYEGQVTDWRVQSHAEAVMNMSNWTYENHLTAKTSYDSVQILMPVGEGTVPDRAGFELQQNYPNPFNSGTVIAFHVPALSDVSLDIYDNRGGIIWQWRGQGLAPGSYRVNFNTGNLPSGSYYYRLFAGNQSHVKKMIILK